VACLTLGFNNLDGAKEGSFSYDRSSDSLTSKPKKALSFGSHTVEVRVEDAAGNQASQNWRFSVVR
jgi:hypothetical protein